MAEQKYYKLSNTGPEIDYLLYKLEKAVLTTPSQTLSTNEMQQARTNIQAASISLETATSSMQTAINSNASAISNLTDDMSELSLSIDSLGEKVANAEEWDLLLSQATTDSAVPLALTLMDYGNLSMYVADEYSSDSNVAIYYLGDYCKNDGKVYECITSETYGAWDSSAWRRINPISETPPSDYMDGGYVFDWLNFYALDGGVISSWPESYEMDGGFITSESTLTTYGGENENTITE